MKEFRVHSCFDYIYVCVCNECNIYIYAAKWRQLCSTLCDPIDGSPPGSPVPGILQARTLEWVASSFSNARKWKVKVKSLSRVWLLATPWTAAYQVPQSMGFSRQEYWSGVPLPSPQRLPNSTQFAYEKVDLEKQSARYTHSLVISGRSRTKA